jgi:hypothetical protein
MAEKFDGLKAILANTKFQVSEMYDYLKNSPLVASRGTA